MLADHRIGVISDTHGLLRPEAEAALRGCSVILHAGDIGGLEVVEQLRRIAPVIAVRGNVDVEPWALEFPVEARVEIGGRTILLFHDRKQIDPAAITSGVDVVICGHSHVPRIGSEGRVLFVNPGSSGPRRFHLPVSLALLRIGKGKVGAELVELMGNPLP